MPGRAGRAAEGRPVRPLAAAAVAVVVRHPSPPGRAVGPTAARSMMMKPADSPRAATQHAAKAQGRLLGRCPQSAVDDGVDGQSGYQASDEGSGERAECYGGERVASLMHTASYPRTLFFAFLNEESTILHCE
jgi:hypothetical protein